MNRRKGGDSRLEKKQNRSTVRPDQNMNCANFDASSAQGISRHIRAQGQGKIGILNRSIGIWRCLATNDDLKWYAIGILYMNQSWCNCGAELRRPSPARRTRDCNTASQQSCHGKYGFPAPCCIFQADLMHFNAYAAYAAYAVQAKLRCLSN